MMAFSKKYVSPSSLPSTTLSRNLAAQSGSRWRQHQQSQHQQQQHVNDSGVESCCGINPYSLFARTSVRKSTAVDVCDVAPLNSSDVCSPSSSDARLDAIYANSAFTADSRSIRSLPPSPVINGDAAVDGTPKSAASVVTAATKEVDSVMTPTSPTSASSTCTIRRLHSRYSDLIGVTSYHAGGPDPVVPSWTPDDGSTEKTARVPENDAQPVKVSSLRRQEHVPRRKSTERFVASSSAATATSLSVDKQLSESRIRVQTTTMRRNRIWDRADVEDIVEAALQAALTKLVEKDYFLSIVGQVEARFASRIDCIERRLLVAAETQFKQAVELHGDVETKIASDSKANQDDLPEIKAAGVKWFDTKKEEKKKKAVDDFFQKILLLPVGGEAVRTFLNLSPPNSVYGGVQQTPQYENSSIGQYEDISAFDLQLNGQPSKSVACDDSALYSFVIKKNSGDAKYSQSPPLPLKTFTSIQNSDEVEAYAEIPATMSNRVDEAPKLPLDLPSPKVPPKIGIPIPAAVKVSGDANANQANSGGSMLAPASSSATSKPSSASTPLTPVSPVTPLKSVPPMPTFAPPPLVTSDDLPDSIESVTDQSEVHIVAVAEYNSASDNVLSFARGSLACLVVQADSQWWCIKLGDAYGWVPADYWRKLKPDGEFASVSAKAGAPWFVGKLTRNECEELLMEHGKQQHFVVRESNNLVGHYALSIKYNDRVHHFPIELTEDNKYYIGKHHFKTIQNIISYYKKNALFFDVNEQGVTLGSPLVIVKH